MLSPRTMSLRLKNRALLKTLEKYTEKVIQNTSTEQQRKGTENVCYKKSGFNPSNDILSLTTCIPPSHECLPRQDLNSTNTLQLYGSCNSLHNSSNDCITFEGSDKIPFANTWDRPQSKQQLLNRTGKIGREYLPVNCSPITSFSDLHTAVHEIVSEMDGDTSPKSPSPSIIKKKNHPSRNCTTTNVKAGRCKTISVDQQRAAEAQMHAPTHSHSLSKCYCIAINNTQATQPDNKYVVQVYGRKQHIPSRLKRQRYRAESISKHSRTVRWADRNDEVRSLHPDSEDQVSLLKSIKKSEICENPFELYETSSSRNFPSHYHHESETSVIDKVKKFRETHWADCHASLQGETLSSAHECMQHYVLNKRSFLEPLHVAANGDGGCPVCSLSPKKPDKETLHGHKSTNHENRSSHVIVTLPTLILEPSLTNTLLIAETSMRRKVDAINWEIQKPCCDEEDHRWSAKESSIPHPSDSLALRYQKKAY